MDSDGKIEQLTDVSTDVVLPASKIPGSSTYTFDNSLATMDSTLGQSVKSRVKNLSQEKLRLISRRLGCEDRSYGGIPEEYERLLASTVSCKTTCLHALPVFTHWRDSGDPGSRSILWIHGRVGSGKSVSTASLICHLAQEQGARVLAFFGPSTFHADRNLRTILRSWISQMLLLSPALQLELNKYQFYGKSIGKLSVADLFQLLRIAFAESPKIFCILDGLEDMQETERANLFDDFTHLVELIQQVSAATEGCGHVRWLITSDTPSASPIGKLMKELGALEIDLGAEDIKRLVTKSDIKPYVEYRLKSHTHYSQEGYS